MHLLLSKHFTPCPEGRDQKTYGDRSAETLRNKYLVPLFLKARKQDELFTVSLEGMRVMAFSFLDEAFGGMVEKLMRQGISYPAICNRLIIVPHQGEYSEHVQAIHQSMWEASQRAQSAPPPPRQPNAAQKPARPRANRAKNRARNKRRAVAKKALSAPIDCF